MMWKSLLAAVLVLPSFAYVAGLLYAEDPAPQQRPALIMPADADTTGPRDPEPRPTTPTIPTIPTIPTVTMTGTTMTTTTST